LTQDVLPTTSINGIKGKWSPAALSTDKVGDIVYTFTPDADQCAVTTTITVNVKDNEKPLFTQIDPICLGASFTLPATSTNSIGGSWSPAVDNTKTTKYVFTPTAVTGRCLDTASMTVEVNPILTPTFNFGTNITICSGQSAPTLSTQSNNGVTGTWSPASVNSTQSDVYTFTPAAGSCANNTTLNVTYYPSLNGTVRKDTTLYHNAVYPGVIFGGLPPQTVINWTNSNSSIGLSATGTGNIPAFTAINNSPQPVTSTITIRFKKGGCPDEVRSFKITVLPLSRDVFIPNIITPNGDGKNDILKPYGNYITRFEMRIFNQWGELIKSMNGPNSSWDGTQNGKPQPVGVYTYTLRATLADGTEINKKGTITLLR
jgi:gliding motility-associated-like protein